jgi:UDPglucose 6-dehydrogenase
MNISVIGLGKLGAVIATLYARKGHKITGVDLNLGIIDDLRNKKAPFDEPYLQDILSKTFDNLIVTSKIDVAIQNSDASLIIVPTPSEENGMFSNEYIISALKSIGQSLRLKNSYHLIIICSTVMPGSCDGEITRVLQESSGRKVGEDLGLIYSPEFIALGSIVKDMLNPDLILIGESDCTAGDLAEKIFKSIVENEPIVKRMNLVNAEIVKIAVNTFITTKISFANMLSEICDKIAFADAETVTNAVGSDKRIGNKYFSSGLGYGGPCFPRDNIALSSLSASLKISCEIPTATDLLNKRQPNRILEIIYRNNLEHTRVAVFGMSYKAGTPVVEESQGIKIANLLFSRGIDVKVHDPQGLDEAKHHLERGIEVEENMDNLVISSDVLIFTTPWDTYQKLSSYELENKILIDCWRMFDVKLYKKSKILHLGRAGS